MNLKNLIFGGAVPANNSKAAYQNSAQAWIPVRDIVNGVVITADNRYVKILELLPMNLNTLSLLESEAVIADFAAYLRISPSNLQTTVLSQRFDLEQYVKNQKEALAQEGNPMCREMIEDNISEVSRIVSNEAITHRFFLSFAYEPAMKARDNTPAGIAGRLNEVGDVARRYLSQCGLEVLMPEYEDNALLELFYEIINKSTSRRVTLPAGVFDMLTDVHGVYSKEDLPFDPNELEEAAEKRRRVPWKKKARPFRMEAGATTVMDVLAPLATDLTSANYIVVDGVYHAYLYVAGYGYASVVGRGWLAPLIEAGEGISLSFQLRRQSRERILSDISNKTMFNRARMREVADTRQDFEELDDAINSGIYLKNGINRNGEEFYYMYTLIEVTASDAQTLEQRVTAVETLCVARDMLAKRCDFKHEQAFLSFLPLCIFDADIERKAKRNALTSGVAAAFPYASFEISDRSGVFLGLGMYNSSPCFIDLFNDYKYLNGNVGVFGSSGAGKSSTLQSLGGRIRQQGKQVIYVIPKKGHEYRPLCETLGGQYIRLAPSSTDCINIMEIRRSSLEGMAHQALSVRADSLLADKIARLTIFYTLLKPNLTEEDKNYIDTSLVECFGKYGITFENASLYDERGEKKEMPTLPDWYEILHHNAETKHLAVVLKRFVSGSAATMGGRTNVDIHNKNIVLDTSAMPDDLKLVGIFWATDFANDVILSSGTPVVDANGRVQYSNLRTALITDELWGLIGANSNQLAASYVVEMVKVIRSLGGIAITSTQGMADMFALEEGKYGKAILDSSRIKFIMQMEENEARFVQEKLNLTEEEVRMVTRFRRGEGLLCIGHNHVPVSVYITPKEYECITTSPTDRANRLTQMTKEIREDEAR